MALYGSVPFLMSHKRQYSTAFLWLNAAEMWVYIEETKENQQELLQTAAQVRQYKIPPCYQGIYDTGRRL